MNILIYMEPWIEKSDPSYRVNSFLVDQNRIINCFLEHDPNSTIKCLVGENIDLEHFPITPGHNRQQKSSSGTQ